MHSDVRRSLSTNSLIYSTNLVEEFAEPRIFLIKFLKYYKQNLTRSEFYKIRRLILNKSKIKVLTTLNLLPVIILLLLFYATT